MRVIAISLLALLTAGCATIMDGSTQAVSFQSNPEDVVVTKITRVRGDGPEYVWHDEFRALGKTPFTVQLDRQDGQSITFSKEGYKPLTMKLTTGTNPNFWGNILFGGFLGSTTDSASGAATQYEPSQYFVSLIPLTASSIDATTQQSAREKAKDLIVRRYANLMADLSRGTGEDLHAVLRMLRVDPAQDTEAIRKMQALSQVYTDAAVYADRAIELHLK